MRCFRSVGPKEARGAVDAALAEQPANLNARIADARLTAISKDLPGALKLVDAVLVDAHEED